MDTLQSTQPGLRVHPQAGNLLKLILELAIFSHGSRCVLTLKGDDTVSANNHKVLLLEPSSLYFRDITSFTFPSNSLTETWLSFTPVPPRVWVPVFFWISFSLFHFFFFPYLNFINSIHYYGDCQLHEVKNRVFLITPVFILITYLLICSKNIYYLTDTVLLTWDTAVNIKKKIPDFIELRTYWRFWRKEQYKDIKYVIC